MKHVKLIGLCLVAVFALGGLVASVAQAEGPEWGRCLHIDPAKGKEIKKGNYEDANCQTEATKLKKGVPVPSHKGHYEWYGGAKTLCEKKATSTFKYKDNACTEIAEKKGVPDNKGKYELGPGQKFSAVGGAGVLTDSLAFCHEDYESLPVTRPREDCFNHELGGEHQPLYAPVAVIKVECAAEHASGEAVGTNELANVSVRFTGCAFSGTPATTKGLAPGEIQVNPLKGHLGYINKAHKEVGVLLEPVTPGGQFAEFLTQENTITVHVGVGNATEGTFFETGGHAGTPNGHDSIISPIIPVDQMSHTFTQEYRGEEAKFHCSEGPPENCADPEVPEFLNIPDHFEGGQLAALETRLEAGEPGEVEHSEWGASGEEVNNTNTVEGEVEIKG